MLFWFWPEIKRNQKKNRKSAISSCATFNSKYGALHGGVVWEERRSPKKFFWNSLSIHIRKNSFWFSYFKQYLLNWRYFESSAFLVLSYQRAFLRKIMTTKRKLCTLKTTGDLLFYIKTSLNTRLFCACFKATYSVQRDWIVRIMERYINLVSFAKTSFLWNDFCARS